VGTGRKLSYLVAIGRYDILCVACCPFRLEAVGLIFYCETRFGDRRVKLVWQSKLKINVTQHKTFDDSQ
jgi:hypothetical protein